MTNPLERHQSGLASRSPAIRDRSTTARNRARRPVLEDLESLCLLSGITVFPAATAEVSPTDITSGPDGNLWFTEAEGDALGKIDRTTHVVTQIPLPDSVGSKSPDLVSIASGPDGNLWFADYNGNTIGMIDPKTDAISVFPVPTPDAGLMDITTGPDGNLWFTEKAANQIGMINPTTHAITEFPVPTASSWLVDIAPGPDGNLWFTEQVGNAIGKIDPTTHAITEFPLPTADSSPSAIAAGPDGNLWFIESGAVGKIDPTTYAITEFPVPSGPSGTILLNGSIATGPDGNLWFGYFNGDEVGSIDPTTDAIAVYPVPLDQPDLAGIGGPSAIAAGPDGNLWITLQNANEIGEFTPETLTVAPEVPLLPYEPILSPPILLSPPPLIPNPVASTIAPEPRNPFGFVLTLDQTTSSAKSDSSGTVNLLLDGNAVGSTITVTRANGVVDTISGLELKKVADGYRFVSRGDRTTATEKLLTAGKGKDKHVVGFEIHLSKPLDPNRHARETVSQPVSLLVVYSSPAGDGKMTVNGKATIVRGGPIVVVARM